jgi:eukaryotic-like serine/threonine-protein kinase
MAPNKNDRTLLSGHPRPIAEESAPSTPAGEGSDEHRTRHGHAVDPARPAWAWVSRSEGPNFGETERFTQKELLGVGGMSTVVRVHDKDLRRDVAIKVLSPELSVSESEVERFATEARITGQLEHPYIVPVYEYGNDPRIGKFICMRLLQGETLDDMIQSAGVARLETDRLADFLQIFVKVCEAVSFAHSRGVIHRDLKPSNVMVSDFGQVYVLDWGVARAAAPPAESTDVPADVDKGAKIDPPGALVGTPSYMAPEQLRGMHDEVDERTDVFALGATLYQILTGQPPRLPESIRSILVGMGRFEITPPEQLVQGANVPAELSRIALKAMSHEPAARYATVRDMRLEIERFLRGSWHLPRVHFSAGSTILREGEPGQSAYIIVEGRCVAYRNDGEAEVVLREMAPGDVFGETAIFSNKPRTASVKALTDVRLMVVTSDILSNALGLNFWMGTFVKALADRFRDVDERLRQIEQLQRSRSIPPR